MIVNNKTFLSSVPGWLFAVLIIFSAGCNKAIEVPLPVGKTTTESTFATDESAQSAMRGFYSGMVAAFSSGPFMAGLTGYLGLSSDELVRASYGTDQQPFFDNNLAPKGSSSYSVIWRPFYNYIYQANNIYMNVEKSTTLSVRVKDQLMGESRAGRALCYFYLVNLFDSLPLALTPDYPTNALLSRTSAADVYKVIIEDLKYAQEKTGAAYTSDTMRIRLNKWAATALLARVQLYQKKWAEAETESSAVINAGPYSLDALDSVFTTRSTEAIFGIANGGSNIYTAEGSSVSGGASSLNSGYRLSTYSVSAFEPNDLRVAKWTRAGTGTGAGSVAPFKYKTFSNTQAGAKAEATIVLRLAEQYLIRAEARAQQNKLAGAIADLDSIRSRAGLPLITNTNPSINKDDLLSAIYHERMTEMFAEFGQRWLDVKRLGLTETIFKVRKPGWRTGISALFPIPQEDRDLNVKLGQNPGYE